MGRAFIRNTFVVMSGTAIAQLIGFAFAPILSRLYGPADFGAFGTYLSITMVIVAGATLNYADTVMLPKEDEEAAPLFLMATLATIIISLVTALCCVFISERALNFIGLREFHRFLWFVPVSVFLLGLGQVFGSWCTRLKAFKVSSQSQVIRSGVNCAAQVAGGAAHFGGAGLIGAAVLADASIAAFLGRATLAQSGRVILASARWPLIRAKAREFREFALYGTPQNVMNALSQGLPVMALAHFYGVAIAGYYAFGMRLLQVPMNFFLTSIRQVLFQKLSHIRANGGDLYFPFLKSTGGLFAISFLPGCLGFILAPALFAWIFGERWREAGEFGRWLILWLIPAFCNVPSTLSLRIVRLQRDFFLYDAALLTARAAVLILGGHWFSSLNTVIALSVVGALFNSGLILFTGARLRSIHKNTAPQTVPLSSTLVERAPGGEAQPLS
jgi:O-antigen/teichoic acid export membrane protein